MRLCAQLSTTVFTLSLLVTMASACGQISISVFASVFCLLSATGAVLLYLLRRSRRRLSHVPEQIQFAPDCFFCVCTFSPGYQLLCRHGNGWARRRGEAKYAPRTCVAPAPPDHASSHASRSRRVAVHFSVLTSASRTFCVVNWNVAKTTWGYMPHSACCCVPSLL